MSSNAYMIGLDRAIAAQWRVYRAWCRKAQHSNTSDWAPYALEVAEISRKRATELEAERAQIVAASL